MSNYNPPIDYDTDDIVKCLHHALDKALMIIHYRNTEGPCYDDVRKMHRLLERSRKYTEKT